MDNPKQDILEREVEEIRERIENTKNPHGKSYWKFENQKSGIKQNWKKVWYDVDALGFEGNFKTDEQIIKGWYEEEEQRRNYESDKIYKKIQSICEDKPQESRSSTFHAIVSELFYQRKMKKNLYDLLQKFSEEELFGRINTNVKIKPWGHNVMEDNYYKNYGSDRLYRALTQQSNWKKESVWYSIKRLILRASKSFYT